LNRLGKTQLVKQVIDETTMCPAAGQGALGIEIRKGDARMREILAFLDDRDARATTTAERSLLNQLGGGCQVPIGAFAELKGGVVYLTAICARPDGSEVLRESQSGLDPARVGEAVGKTLLARGADKILEDVYGETAAAPAQP
jgi:hydroxymethylbilane synthase